MQALRKWTLQVPWVANFVRVRQRGSPYRHAGAFLAGMLALLLVTTVYAVLDTRAGVWRQANESALTVALGLESASSAVLAQPISSLQSISKDLATGGLSAREILATAVRFDPTSVFMGVGAPDGTVTVLARDGSSSNEVTEALRMRLRSPQPEGFGVQPLINVPGRTEWFLPITLAAKDASGAFVFSLVSTRQLVTAADSLRLLPHSYVAFVAADGRSLLRYWRDNDTLEVNGLALPEDRLDAMKGEGHGSFEVSNTVTQQSQVVGYAHSSVLPMYVGAVVPTSDLYRQWARESTGPVLVLVMGAAAVAAYALRLRRALRAEAEVREQALTDKLTGLSNRRSLDADIRQAIALSSRCGEKFAVVMIDIDFFKAINDRFGHHVGDEVLHDFARRLDAALRAQDRAYRYGGEEFCVLLPATDAAGASVLAERLRRAVAQPASAKMHAVTASFGVAIWEPGDDDALLLGRADEALYRAKAAGRNRVELA